MANKQLFVNNFIVALAGDVSTTVQTTFELTDVTGLSALTGGDYYILVLKNLTKTEIVKVTAVNIGLKEITVERAHEGVGPFTWVTTEQVALKITAEPLNNFTDDIVTAQATADSALQNVVEDTTPQAGGDFDFQSNNLLAVNDIDFEGAVYKEGPNSTEVIRPVGGQFVGSGTNEIGAIKIKLPITPADNSNTMLQMWVTYFTFIVSNSTYKPFSMYITARATNGGAWSGFGAVTETGEVVKVTFADDGTDMCIILGAVGDDHDISVITVEKVQVSFNNFGAVVWKDDYAVTLETDITTGYTNSGDVTTGSEYAESGGFKQTPVPANAMTPNTTNGAEIGTTESTTNKVMLDTMDFDQTTAESVQFIYRFGDDWASPISGVN